MEKKVTKKQAVENFKAEIQAAFAEAHEASEEAFALKYEQATTL